MGVKTSSTNTKTCTFRALCAHTNDIVYLTIILHKKKVSNGQTIGHSKSLLLVYSSATTGLYLGTRAFMMHQPMR